MSALKSSETGAGSVSALNETMKGCSAMRSRITSALVALMAVLALGAVAASGASAHEYFIEGKSMKSLGLKEEAVTSVGGPAQLFIQNGEILCESSSGVGTIREGGAGVMTLELSECRVNLSGCSVSSIVLRNTTDNLVEVEGKLADEFAGENGGHQLFEMEIQGTHCILGGPWQVEGQITGLVVSETEKEVGELNFTKTTSGTNIRTGSWILGFRLKDKVALSGADKGKKWSAKK